MKPNFLLVAVFLTVSQAFPAGIGSNCIDTDTCPEHYTCPSGKHCELVSLSIFYRACRKPHCAGAVHPSPSPSPITYQPLLIDQQTPTNGACTPNGIGLCAQRQETCVISALEAGGDIISWSEVCQPVDGPQKFQNAGGNGAPSVPEPTDIVPCEVPACTIVCPAGTQCYVKVWEATCRPVQWCA
ncbi:hypothetical protein BCR33DRAFT_716316 [Rhizoclosmatium globosum]|uniref:CBM1 domain-containing protein n=1 Tax=Rhizoclosmatium globosum TaxID=329046 RepID=A0A1Y2CF76_9FUNG|nr:hypothetical protein BCR33DRAFT_716316 [Rhizoclosmatium globosum]|eukprot:ORY45672.1 hypothetical protein BCR33DRAFT_716316 [Rhizoclosmatium globosum]